MSCTRTSKRPLKFGLPPHLEATYGGRLVEIMEWLKTKVRLHGYFVSREIVLPRHPLTRKPLKGMRLFLVGSDGFSLTEEPTMVDISLLPQNWSFSRRAKAGTRIALTIKVTRMNDDFESVRSDTLLHLDCAMRHHAVVKMLSMSDRLDEARRKLLWDLHDFVPKPSPKHWWPKKPSESKLEKETPPA